MAINIYGDPLLGGNTYNTSPEVLRAQQEYAAKIEAYRQQQQVLQPQQNVSQNPIWDKIDEEISTLTDMQKQNLYESAEFKESSDNVQAFLQNLFLSIMKPQVEGNPEGKELLQKQYEVVKKLKKNVVESTNKDMELLRKFQEFSAAHPTATYQEFLNLNKQ